MLLKQAWDINGVWYTRPKDDSPRYYHVRRSQQNTDYVWVWPDHGTNNLPYNNAADYLHVGPYNPDNKGSGYYGRTIEFELLPGCDMCVDVLNDLELNNDGVLKLYGPWHSNADALFNDLNIDFRQTCLTRGIICRERISERDMGDLDLLSDNVLHYDTEWTTGAWQRIETLAHRQARIHGLKSVWYWMMSMGGGTASTIYVEDES